MLSEAASMIKPLLKAGTTTLTNPCIIRLKSDVRLEIKKVHQLHLLFFPRKMSPGPLPTRYSHLMTQNRILHERHDSFGHRNRISFLCQIAGSAIYYSFWDSRMPSRDYRQAM